MSLSKIVSSGVWLVSIFCLCKFANAQSISSVIATIDPIGFIKTAPLESSETLATLELGDSVLLDTAYYERPYFHVKSGTVDGYISIACLALTCDVLDIIYKHTHRDYRPGCRQLINLRNGEWNVTAIIDPIGFIKAATSENSKTLTTLEPGDSVFLDTEYYERPYFHVKSGMVDGYISVACLALTCDVLEIIYRHTYRDYRAGCLPLTDMRNVTISQMSPTKIQTIYSATDCHKTANCGCSNKRKAECGGPCCRWIVGQGCSCN